MENMTNAVRAAEKAFGVDGEIEVKRHMGDRVVEISPNGFGWIWSIEYSTAREAQKVANRLAKLSQEKLQGMWSHADQNIRFKSKQFQTDSRNLIQEYLTR